ncbi:MAG: helix-turn-helix domain-containing protein [Alphaproteobacteria bacterium]
MKHTIENIARVLKEARLAKGLSQRDLSARVGVPQSHISKIESGVVDLRVSSLIELARIYDLELALVPRKTVPAVQSIVRASTTSTPLGVNAGQRAFKELNRLQERLANFPELAKAPKELAQLQRQIRELQHFPLGKTELRSIQDAHKTFKEFVSDPHNVWALREAVSDLQNLRNTLAHKTGTVNDHEPALARAAYSLDEEGDND